MGTIITTMVISGCSSSTVWMGYRDQTLAQVMKFHDFDPYKAIMDLNENCQSLFRSMQQVALAHNQTQADLTNLAVKVAQLEHHLKLQQTQNVQLRRQLSELSVNIQKDQNGQASDNQTNNQG